MRGRPEPVSKAPFRDQKRNVEVAIDLAPQTRNIDVYDIRSRIEMHTPYIAEQHVARDKFARITGEIFQ